MKKLRTVLVAMAALSLMSVTAYASSNEQTLDEVIGAESSVVQDVGTSETGETGETGKTGDGSTINGDSFKEVFGSGGIDNKSQIDNLKNATKLDGSSEAASKVNSTLSKVLSVVIQVISYAVTALLVLRVLLDLAYIVLPFTRSFLSNGYGSNVQPGMGMGAPGMGMGAPGMGMGMGRRGMYGMGAPGMGMGAPGMGMGMGMGAPGMNGMEGSQPGATPSMGRVQLISKTALNAVAAEGVIGPNGKSISPLKTYAKDMVIVLVLAPTFLTLAITGVLTQLGITLGELLAMGISNLGNMF